MNSAQGQHRRDLESKLRYHPTLSSPNEKDAWEEHAGRRSETMSKLPQYVVTVLLLLGLVAVGIVSATAHHQALQAAPLSLSPEESRFRELLNSVDPAALHDVLHEKIKDKYQHGVFQEDRTAMEAIHRQNAEVAENLIELAKRQAGSSGNGTVVTTTSVTTTDSVTVSIVSDTSTPSSTAAAASAESSTSPAPSSTGLSAEQSTSALPSSQPAASAVGSAITTAEASSSATGGVSTSLGGSTTARPSSTGSTPASTSHTSTSTGTYAERRSLVYPFVPAVYVRDANSSPESSSASLSLPSVPSSSIFSPISLNSHPLNFPMFCMGIVAPASVSASTASASPASSQYAAAPTSSELLNTTTVAALNRSSIASISAPSTSPIVAGLSITVPANTSSLSPASSPYAAAPGSSSSLNSSNLASPEAFEPISSSTSPTLPKSTFFRTPPVPGPSGYVYSNSTSGATSPSNSSSSTSSSSLSSSLLRFSSSDTTTASTAQSLSKSQDGSKTTASSSQTTIYTTTIANGVLSTVTSVKIIPAGQADQTAGSGSATTTPGNPSLQTGAGGRFTVGFSAVLGGAVMAFMGAL